MATIDLGRIKPVWQGTWAGSTAYEVEDIVRHGADTYICTTAHTSDATTFSNDSANWETMAQGADIPSQSGQSGKALVTDGTTLSWGNGGALLQVKTFRKLSNWSSGNNPTGRVEVAPFNGTASITPSSTDSVIGVSFHIIVKHATTWRSGYLVAQYSTDGSNWNDFGMSTSTTYGADNMSGNDYTGMFFIPNQNTTNTHYVRLYNKPHDNGHNHRLGGTHHDYTADNTSQILTRGCGAILSLYEYAGSVASISDTA